MASSPLTGHIEPSQMTYENVPLQQGTPTAGPYLINKGYRACFECRRKKTKCDMRQPVCGLCYRTGGSCTFPTKRKTPEQRKATNPPESKKRKLDPERLERLVNLLESKLTSDSASDQISLPTASESRMSRTALPQNDDAPEMSIPVNPDSCDEATPSRDDSFLSFSTGSPEGSRHDHRSSETSQTSIRICDVSSIFDIPEELATELITIFFIKIQAWLPLLHKPKFFSQYMTNPGSTFAKKDEYSTLQMFQLYGIFALAARFFNNPFEESTSPDRGGRFAALAEECYTTLRGSEDELTLCYLQGCILLAFYLYTSGPNHKSWVLTGVCVRFVYDLDLHNIDQEDSMAESKESWVDLEEHRRAFWLVWELDAFSAIMSRRPHAIDRRRIAVKLPVSDVAWFSNEPVDSPLVDPRPSESWKVLLSSSNQDARAWFLLANYLLAVCNDACSSRYAGNSQDQDDLADSVTCLTLAITQRFGPEKHPLVFESDNFAKSNWIIGMHLMLLGARSFVSTLGGTRATGTLTSWREVGHLLFHWHPNYVESSHPFFVCSLLPTYNQLSRELLHPPRGSSIPHQDMLMLILSGHAAFWKLGSILLDILKILSDGTGLAGEDAQLAKYFAIYFPHASSSARRRSNTNSSPPVDERRSFGRGNFSDSVSRNVESFEEVFEIPDTSLDCTEMVDKTHMNNSTTTGTPCKPFATGDHVYTIDQNLQLELDRLDDDHQLFRYLAF